MLTNYLKSFTLVLTMTMLVFAANVMAQTKGDQPQPTSPSQTAVTEQNRENVRRSIEALGKVFEVETPKPTPPTPQATPSLPAVTEKTIADVLDKAVDKVSDVVSAMAKVLSDIAPDIWRIMLKQQYTKALSNLVVPLGLTLILYVFVVRSLGRLRDKYAQSAKINKTAKNNDGTEHDLVDEAGTALILNEKGDTTDYGFISILHTISYVPLAFSLLWFANRLSDAAKFLINPEFYAIQDLLRMILSRSAQ